MRRDGDVRTRRDVLLEHFLVIHFVDVIAGEDEDVIRLLAADGINVLVDGVGRAHDTSAARRASAAAALR